MWPSMVTHTRNLCSAFNPSKCTHNVNTHPEQWAANVAAPGEHWGFGVLLKGLTSVVVLKVERTLVIHFPHRQFLPDPRFEHTTSGYKSDALCIRPRLPRDILKVKYQILPVPNYLGSSIHIYFIQINVLHSLFIVYFYKREK